MDDLDDAIAGTALVVIGRHGARIITNATGRRNATRATGASHDREGGAESPG